MELIPSNGGRNVKEANSIAEEYSRDERNTFYGDTAHAIYEW